MRDRFKQLYFWLIGFLNSIVSIVLIVFSSSPRAAIKLRKYKNNGKGKRGYVLANGPSLLHCLKDAQSREEMISNDCIVMNNFANSDYFKIVRPRYYIILDYLYYDNDHLKNSETDRKLFENMNDINWDMILFLASSHNKSAIKQLLTNPHIKIVEFNGNKTLGHRWIQNLFYKWNLGIPSCRNVIIPAILLMINSGYSTIYLYGAEFSWTKYIDIDPLNNKAYMNDTHFYKREDIHHYEKGWYKWYLESVVDMLNGTEQIALYAKKNNVQILNRTPGSFIDAFEYERPYYLNENEKNN